MKKWKGRNGTMERPSCEMAYDDCTSEAVAALAILHPARKGISPEKLELVFVCREDLEGITSRLARLGVTFTTREL